MPSLKLKYSVPIRGQTLLQCRGSASVNRSLIHEALAHSAFRLGITSHGQMKALPRAFQVNNAFAAFTSFWRNICGKF